MAGNPSWLGAFYTLTSITFSSTSSIVRLGMATSPRRDYGPLSSISTGSDRKKTPSSSSAYLTLSYIIILLVLFSRDTLLPLLLHPGLRYLVAY
jgi:hypothetical protein